MSRNSCYDKIDRLLSLAGIRINGEQPWDIQVHNYDFCQRIMAQGTLGFGESCMHGWWDCHAIDEMVNRAFRSKIHGEVPLAVNTLDLFKAKFRNRLINSHAYQVGECFRQRMWASICVHAPFASGRAATSCGNSFFHRKGGEGGYLAVR